MSLKSISLVYIVKLRKLLKNQVSLLPFCAQTSLCKTLSTFILVKNQSSIYLPAGDGKVSFVDVRDVAAVAVQALTNNKNDIHSEKAYTITGPESISYGEAAGILSEYIGRKISYVNITEDDARKLIKELGMNDWHTNILLELLKLSREGYLSNISPAVEEVTGRKPIPFSQFTKDHALAFK
jgi:uncharacterized protein YbjT (DUF2867 family)